ncbi:MAG: hypothetical protein M3Q58_07345 [Bacteroidota bacterium]|nr:hypothetical protein [Bacteroidota bacterium]
MIRIKDIEGDFYIYDEESYCLTGKKHKKTYQIGDKLKIEVKRVALMKKQIDFILAKD